MNTDGSVTLWAVTSTVSASGDQGADPNKLVSITDALANTDPAVAANEKFTTLKTAAAGEVLRGVSFAPTSGTTPAANVPLIVSAANSGAGALAPGSLATANGTNLATSTAGLATLPLPATFGGSSIAIVDSAGKSSPAPLLYVSPTQINFEVPAGVALGMAQVTITSGDGTKSTASVQIAATAPGLFTLNNAGLAAANAFRVSANGSRTTQLVYAQDSGGAIVANPISLGSAPDQVYLELYGTGLQAAGTKAVTVSVAGIDVQVLYAGPQGSFAGLDQVNIQLPATLAGKGNVNIQLTTGGISANPVQVTIQ